MQMKRESWNNCNDRIYSYRNKNDEIDPLPVSCNGDIDDHIETPTKFFSSSSPLDMAKGLPSLSRHGFIEHHVSKMDTLAGVAIKYGVEVADIRKMNGLVTDLQMFALKSLQIPLPGRHPPASCLSNGHETARPQTSCYHVHSNLFDSFQSLSLNSSQQKVSPAMSSLQGYYGLKPTRNPKYSEAFEMDDYNKEENIQYLRPLPASNTPLSRHRKSRSLANDLLDENNGLADYQLSTEVIENDWQKWIKRRQKSEADFTFTSTCNETVMREDSCGGASSAITGKSLALRSKAASRSILPNDAEIGVSPDSSTTSAFTSVRKSSSTSSLQDQESSSSPVWSASKWSLKPDLQALSATAITRPIFNGLPKPITSRRTKAALD